MRGAFLVLTVMLVAILAAGCVFHVTHYRDKDDGSLVYVGDALNTGDMPLVEAAVEATLYDASGTVIATKTQKLCLDILPAKGVRPFSVTLPPSTRDAARVEWKIVGTPTAEPYLATGLEAGVVSELKDAEGKSWITGEIKNTSANQYHWGLVCASWTNAAGDVLRVSSEQTDLIRFGPGDVLPFALLQDVPPEATSINFYLDAGVSVPGQPSPAVVDLPSSAFRHVFSSALPNGEGAEFGAVGEIHNTGTTTLRSPGISAEVRDANGKLLAASHAALLCPAKLRPGSFTYAGYVGLAPASTLPVVSPEVRIQAREALADESVALPTSNVQVQVVAPHLARVTGVVNNPTTKTLSSITVCAGVYDESGKVKGAYFAMPSLPAGGLAPGQSVSFAVGVVNAGSAATGKAFAEGVP